MSIMRISTKDILVYLVCGVSTYTYEHFKNYKSLEVQFTDNRVQVAQIFRVNNQKTVIGTKVTNNF